MMEECILQPEWRYGYYGEDLDYLRGISFNSTIDLDERMLDLDSSLSELPLWIDPFVEDGGSLISEFLGVDGNFINYKELPNTSQQKTEAMIHDGAELLNYDQRFSGFSSNETESNGLGNLAIEDNGSLDSSSIALELSSIQEDLMDNGSLDSSSMALEFSSIQEDLMEEIMTEEEARKTQGICNYDKDAMSIEAEQISSVENNSTSSAPVNCATKNLISYGSADSSDYRGILTIHLLTACAEAISDGSHDLVEILLCRLREMVSPTGSTMERVAFYLSCALQQRHHLSSGGDPIGVKLLNLRDMGALSLFNQVYPFIRIAHFTANQSILEAIKGERRKVHIIDFDIMEGMQWPPLMEALKSEGYKIEHLKITALKWDCGDVENDDDDNGGGGDPDSVPLCTHTGRRLSAYADSLGIPFSFEETDLENMKTNKDEIVAVNCMWELPHMCERSRKGLVDFIHGARQLNPVILTIGTGPPDELHKKLNLLESFGECLRNLCAVFDCSEAGLPEQFGLARAKMERLFLAPMICRPLNYSPCKDGQLGPLVLDIPPKCGFVQGEISSKNSLFAKQMLLSGLSMHYRVEFVGSHQLLLQWHSTVLSRVSIWKPINYNKHNIPIVYLSP